jgi:hypothetical protein
MPCQSSSLSTRMRRSLVTTDTTAWFPASQGCPKGVGLPDHCTRSMVSEWPGFILAGRHGFSRLCWWSTVVVALSCAGGGGR